MGNLGAPNHSPHDPIQFEGYVKAMRTNERDGEMLLTVAVPPEYKFIALLTTDYPGTMFDLTFTRQDTSGGDEDDGDADTVPPDTATTDPATTPPRFESPWQTTDN